MIIKKAKALDRYKSEIDVVKIVWDDVKEDSLPHSKKFNTAINFLTVMDEANRKYYNSDARFIGIDSSQRPIRILYNAIPDLKDRIQKSIKSEPFQSSIKEQSKSIAKIDTSSVKTKQIIAELSKYEQQYSNLVQKKKNASQNIKPEIDKQIKDINSKVAIIISENPEIKTAVASSKSIENDVESINAINTGVDNHKNSNKSSIQWFKEGYFLQFGEFRVLLQYLDKNLGIQVQVCKTSDSGKCEKPILNQKWIKYKEPIQFTDEGDTYQINLEDINHAGKNPFKLAAYITFEKK